MHFGPNPNKGGVFYINGVSKLANIPTRIFTFYHFSNCNANKDVSSWGGTSEDTGIYHQDIWFRVACVFSFLDRPFLYMK